MIERKSKKLKIGILVDGLNVNFYTYDLIQLFLSQVIFPLRL